MKIILLTVLSVILLSTLTACTNQTTTPTTENYLEETTMYQKITAEEAKKILDEQTDLIILDVRSEEEFAEAHIENALLLPDYEISEKADTVLPLKDAQILVYCRTGRRSAAAALKLINLGYTNVLDFGGIVDWPYDTVQ